MDPRADAPTAHRDALAGNLAVFTRLPYAFAAGLDE
jgi:hypothetical protein